MENKRIKVKKKRIRVAAWVLQGQLPTLPHGAPHGRLGGRSPAEVVMVGPGGCPGQMQPELVLITVLPPPWSQLPPTPATPTPPWPGWTWVTSGSTGGCSRASSSRAQQSFCQYQSEVWASADVHIFDCTCSICEKKQNRHFIVLASHFKLLKGTKPHTHSTGTKHNTPVRDGMFRAFTLSAQTLEVPDLCPRPTAWMRALPGMWSVRNLMTSVGRKPWRSTRPSRTCLKSELLLLPLWAGGMVWTNSFAVLAAPWWCSWMADPDCWFCWPACGHLDLCRLLQLRVSPGSTLSFFSPGFDVG